MSDLDKIDRRVMDDKIDMAREADRPKPPQKEQRSAFDEVLEQSRVQNQASFSSRLQSQKATQQGVQEAEGNQDRRRHEKDKKGKGDEKEGSRKDRSENQNASESGHKRIIGKTGTQEQGGQSSAGGGGSGGSSFGRHSSSKGIELKKGERSRMEAAVQTEKFRETLVKQTQQNAQKRGLDPELLQKLVRYVRVGLNGLGEKEIQIDLYEAVFRGLQLRLASKGGKVKVHFLASERDTRVLFEKNASAIRGALEAKGILVESIQVS